MVTAPTAVFVLWFRSEAAAGDKGGTLNTAAHGAQRKAAGGHLPPYCVFIFICVFILVFLWLESPSSLSGSCLLLHCCGHTCVQALLSVRGKEGVRR